MWTDFYPSTSCFLGDRQIIFPQFLAVPWSSRVPRAGAQPVKRGYSCRNEGNSRYSVPGLLLRVDQVQHVRSLCSVQMDGDSVGSEFA